MNIFRVKKVTFDVIKILIRVKVEDQQSVLRELLNSCTYIIVEQGNLKTIFSCLKRFGAEFVICLFEGMFMMI